MALGWRGSDEGTDSCSQCQVAVDPLRLDWLFAKGLLSLSSAGERQEENEWRDGLSQAIKL